MAARGDAARLHAAAYCLTDTGLLWYTRLYPSPGGLHPALMMMMIFIGALFCNLHGDILPPVGIGKCLIMWQIETKLA